MDAGQRVDAPFDRARVIGGIDVAREPHDRLHQRERVLGAMIDFARKQRLAFLGCFAVGDVDGNTAHPDECAGRVMRRRGTRQAPANFAIWPPRTVFHLEWRTGGKEAVPSLIQYGEIVRIDEGAYVFSGDHEIRADAENPPLALIPEVKV